ncbi:hypothetical protein [Chitinophaga barathri]|uniref:Uncharacterized protein n=1 Tax=Chitinophaga barathri TaxID=1647451 RepID=A0A3N4M693_9BACT|nr:hypothetical protein [Chitinophaga barathri]RPD38761.1 hypothetical protein EG028_23950 [Chitinophaga barathri]
MKRILFSLMAVAGTIFTVQAQSDQYKSAMKQQVALLDSNSTFTVGGMQQLANTFERIAEAEKTQWLPYYYAAYCRVNEAFMTENKSKTDEIIDKSVLNIEKAQALKGPDSEISCILSLIASARIGVDPMTRGMKYGPESAELLETAQKQNPENPRVFVLKGQSAMYTPEAFGGSKTRAKEMFDIALKKFATFKPESDIAPNWGEGYVKELIKQVQ